MFGKSEWFRPSRGRVGIVPVRWQGWAYSGAWSGVIGAPTAALVAAGAWIEPLVWIGFSGGILMWDMLQVRRELAPPQTKAAAVEDNVFYIGDDETTDRLATRHFEMQLRK